MKDPVVQFRDVNLSYGSRMVLQDFNIEIPSQQVVGILGPNGSGKSSFFRLIMGLNQPDDGEIAVLGHSPGWRNNHQIAYLPDRARWYGNHTVEGAIQWGGDLLPGFDSMKAKELAEWMEIDSSMRIDEMSKGQEARLMLIMCLARKVPLIILDEPFTGIDTHSRERIMDALIDYVTEGEQTILISTHEIYEAEGLFDSVFLINEGQVALSGEAELLRAEHGSMMQLVKKMSHGGRGL
ncbi:ATP-binding cassette domain-containing protein [Marininema halotolerans]|uniref:ABC-2 type transport system ATP-binding protein n=1 Tax=Marininema halotolerans TaxID=1155944 RepID=A0A1I6U4V0_9BACL|nr:ABC transporter ATP-binding protein [Marininema halotolerans]SFS96424.1 ABC-2 type transport system ATP-binding protein [Marininema halotolerans]